MNIIKAFVFTAIIFHAANAYAADGCDLLLRDGVFQTISTSANNAGYEKIHNLLCDQTKSLQDNTSSANGAANVVIDGLPLGGNMAQASAFRASYQHNFCHLTDNQSFTSDEKDSFVRVADPNLVQAYNECRRTRDNGLQIETTLLPSKTSMTFQIQYVQGHRTNDYIHKIQISPIDGASCDVGTFRAETRLSPKSYTVTCTRKSDAEISVTLDTDAGAYQKVFPSLEPGKTKAQMLAEISEQKLSLQDQASKITQMVGAQSALQANFDSLKSSILPILGQWDVWVDRKPNGAVVNILENGSSDQGGKWFCQGVEFHWPGGAGFIDYINAGIQPISDAKDLNGRNNYGHEIIFKRGP